tara:strand:+ start:11550 stop:12437 length:888 start_codon:yes stop_codon:yes gene_type:complete
MANLQDTFSHRGPEPEQRVLYLLGTPIGNLNDISARAINILSKVSLIACEDTRNTMQLMQYLKIKNKLISFNDHNAKKKISYLISELKKGNSIALVSNAGMPLISDPGQILVNEAKKESIEIITIPGPCAALTALICSGLSAKSFTFFGFLPKSGKERKEILNSIKFSRHTSIIYESPKRIIKLLKELNKICGGDRNISLSRELTKKFEQHIGNDIDNVLNFFVDKEPKGEFTLIISAFESCDEDQEGKYKILKRELIELIEAGLSHSAASIYLSKKYQTSKNKIYKLLIKNNVV